MTKIVNLLGGPGCGKSTTAAALFAELKLRGAHCEHVQEWVKGWAWEGRAPDGPFDQLYIFAKQARAEARLFGKVDFVITDSPVLFSAFYEQKYLGHTIVKDSLPEYYRAARTAGVEHLNFFLSRFKDYDPRGRYQTADEAAEIDGEMLEFLRINGFPVEHVTVQDRERAIWLADRLIERQALDEVLTWTF